ncbi:hypothetical protein COT44_01480, partial [Candidatus Shapirobacteria bacterium CG08_land_8_20_14_0_20_39_18]
KFPDWNRPKWWKMADSFVVLYGNGVPKKSRVQKNKQSLFLTLLEIAEARRVLRQAQDKWAHSVSSV